MDVPEFVSFKYFKMVVKPLLTSVEPGDDEGEIILHGQDLLAAEEAVIFYGVDSKLTIKPYTPTGDTQSIVVDEALSGQTVTKVQLKTHHGHTSTVPAISVLVPGEPPPAPPINTAIPVLTGGSVEGNVVSTDDGSWSNSPTSYSYKWYRCDSGGLNPVEIIGETTNSYTLTVGDVGSTVRSEVTATNADGSASAQSAASAVVDAIPTPPVNTAVPAITGTATEGEILSVDNGTWDNSPTSYEYQWHACDSGGANCVDIVGATSNTYTLTAGEVGDTIKATVTAINADGSADATSAATAVVGAAGPPPDNTAPTITDDFDFISLGPGGTPIFYQGSNVLEEDHWDGEPLQDWNFSVRIHDTPLVAPGDGPPPNQAWANIPYSNVTLIPFEGGGQPGGAPIVASNGDRQGDYNFTVPESYFVGTVDSGQWWLFTIRAEDTAGNVATRDFSIQTNLLM